MVATCTAAAAMSGRMCRIEEARRTNDDGRSGHYYAKSISSLLPSHSRTRGGAPDKYLAAPAAYMAADLGGWPPEGAAPACQVHYVATSRRPHLLDLWPF